MSKPEDYLVYCEQCGKRGCVCDDIFPKSRATIRDALQELEDQCPSCSRLSAKMKDREGLAKAAYSADPVYRFPSFHKTYLWEELHDRDKRDAYKIADALIKYLTE